MSAFRIVPELTHRLRRVALPGSVGSLRAPGCHRVQESVQEDPSESRHTEHRVEVTGHFCHPTSSETFATLLSAHGKQEGEKRKKKKALKMTSLLTRACRLEDHLVGSPFPKLSATVQLLSWNFSPVTLRSSWKLFGEFPRCAPKVWSVLTPGEGGGTISAAPPPHPLYTPPQHTHAHAL